MCVKDRCGDSVLLCDFLKTVHLFAETKDHKAVNLLPDTIPHILPVGGIHFDGVVPDFVEPGKVGSVCLPGSPGAFLMLLVLQVYSNPKTGNNQDQDDYKWGILLYHLSTFVQQVYLSDPLNSTSKVVFS